MKKRTITEAPGRELRLAELRDIEVRKAGGEEPIGFKGVAAVFNKRTRIGGSSMWGWFEEIAPGTFVQSIGEDDIRMLKNHNTDLPLARNTAGSLRLAENDIGLPVDADMDPVSYAFDLATSLQRGTVSQMSFAFEIKSDEWITLDDDDPDKGKVIEPELRVIKRVKLWEVSPVTFPAYVDTEASLRFRDLDTLVRGLGVDDERLHEIAAEIRSKKPDLEAIRALALGLAETAPEAPTAPATEPSSDMPTGRSRLEVVSAMFPRR